MKLFFSFLLLLCSTFTMQAQPAPKSGHELITKMYNAHKGKWYSTLLFSQEVLNYKNDSLVSKDVWHEAYLSPGKLVLKFSTWESGRGVLFANDSLYTFQEGKVAGVRYRMHDLIVLGFDVNNIAPALTAERATKMGYDLSKIAPSVCLGQPAWVVGDTTSLCFWVDMESLLFLKMHRGVGENARDVEFAKYELVEGLPVATEIRFYEAAGKLTMVERYFDVRPNAPVDPAVFDPKKFVEAKW